MTTPVYPLGQQSVQEPPLRPVAPGPAGAQWGVPQPEPVPATFQAQPPVPLPAYEQPVPQLADQANAAPQIPEGGYAKRFVDIPLPELNLPGIECSVRIRNPGMMSQGAFESMMAAMEGVKLDASGEPDATHAAEAMPGMHEQLLKLIAAWRVWDAESVEDVPPMLPSPPTTAEDLQRAPVVVMKAVMAAVKELQDPQ